MKIINLTLLQLKKVCIDLCVYEMHLLQKSLVVYKNYAYAHFILFTYYLFYSILVSRIYQRKNAFDCGKKEQINLCFDQNQHIGGNAENHEGETLTFRIKNNTNITYQGMNANPNYFWRIKCEKKLSIPIN